MAKAFGAALNVAKSSTANPLQFLALVFMSFNYVVSFFKPAVSSGYAQLSLL